nr:isoform 2 of abc transporter c family member 3 [Quercus suber]
MLANVPLGRLQEKFQDKLMESKDKRMKATSEILSNMRILKLQGWEMKFQSNIMELRGTEAGWLKKFLYTSAFSSFVFWGAPTFVSVFTFVSLDRIVSFLCLDDLQSDVIERLPRGSSDTAIKIIDGNFCWDLSSSSATLKDINLKVQQGMRVAVCGTVGSGKSSLLSCIVLEVPEISGKVKLCGTKAYVAQSPWIQAETARRDRSASCDLRSATRSRGVSGERWLDKDDERRSELRLRVTADMTVLPWECLLGLLDSKTVVYVTHQVEFLPAADLILVMKDGRITQSGKHNDILNSGTDFMELVGVHKKALLGLDSIEAGSVSGSMNKDAGNLDSTNWVVEKQEDNDVQNCKEGVVVNSKLQIIQEEEREKGGVSNYWMAWATPVSEDVKPSVDSSTLMIVYVALAIGSSFCVLVRSMLIRTAEYSTANQLRKMHFCIFCAPMSFFDATPSGRILSRASTDQNAVDLSILNEMGAVAFSVIQLLGIILVMSQAAWQVFIILSQLLQPVSSISNIRYLLQELSRLVGVCKAPVIQHFTETISGATTIRSFDEESRFRDTNMKLADANSRPRFNIAGAMEWLCFPLDMLSSITFVFSLFFLISIPEGVIDPG